MTRLGINQLRGTVTEIHHIIHQRIEELPANTRRRPISIVCEPSLAAAEACYHVRTLLQSVDYDVSEQITDMGIQFNYFNKKYESELRRSTRRQVHYIVKEYLSPDQSDASTPSLQVHILCGDGRLFTAFRQMLIVDRILSPPILERDGYNIIGGNRLEHAQGFHFEAIGSDTLTLENPLRDRRRSRLPDSQSVQTMEPLTLPREEFMAWSRSKSGPCSLAYFIENRGYLAIRISAVASRYADQVASYLKTEWNPYLAGLFIYACRVELTELRLNSMHEAPANAHQGARTNQCSPQAPAASAGPSGDCA